MRVEGNQLSGYKAEGAATQENIKLLPPSRHPSNEKQSSEIQVGDNKTISREELDKKVEQLNKAAEALDRKLQFKIHDETHRIMVKILHKDTQEVIAEYPPQKILDVLAKIDEEMGLLVDTRA